MRERTRAGTLIEDEDTDALAMHVFTEAREVPSTVIDMMLFCSKCGGRQKCRSGTATVVADCKAPSLGSPHLWSLLREC